MLNDLAVQKGREEKLQNIGRQLSEAGKPAGESGSFCYFFALQTFDEDDGNQSDLGIDGDIFNFLQDAFSQDPNGSFAGDDNLDEDIVGAIIEPFLDTPFVDKELVLNNWTRIIFEEMDGVLGKEIFLMIVGTLPEGFKDRHENQGIEGVSVDETESP